MIKRYPVMAITALFALILLTTIVIFAYGRSWGLSASIAWLSWGAFVAAECFGYRFALSLLHMNRTRRQALPAHLLQGTFIALYMLLLIGFTAIAAVFRISFGFYAALHALTFGGFLAALYAASKYARYVSDREAEAAQRTFFMNEMKSSLRTIKQRLAEWPHDEKRPLEALIDELSERIATADPYSRPSSALLEDGILWQMKELERCISRLHEQDGPARHLEMSKQLAADIALDMKKRSSKLLTVG